MLAYHEIGTPLHAHAVRSPADYLDKQAALIWQGKQLHPHLPWRDPFVFVGEPPRPVINWGRWIVYCVCGNAPSAHPEWRLACCFECGAIYQQLEFPPDRAAIEALLLHRPSQAARNWGHAETLGEIAAQNSAHGHEVT